MTKPNHESLLSEEQVIDIIKSYVKTQFPKDCKVCGRSFQTWKDYLENTTRLGNLRSFDAEGQNWEPNNPLGGIAFSTCNFCNNTLSVNSSNMEAETMRQLLLWVKKEVSLKDMSIDELLSDLRIKITSEVLGSGDI